MLFVNAGIVRMAPLDEVTPERIDPLLDVNGEGALPTVQRALPVLRPGGSVILHTSRVPYEGWAGMSADADTKAAVRSLAHSLSAELLPRGPRVNAVSPGQVPRGRFGQPREIVDAEAFLASGDPSFVVRVDLTVDGGMTPL